MKRRVFTAVLAALAAFVAVQAWAQAYPNRPVRVVVAAATGGPDIVARIVAAELTTQLGQSFFVENQPGANGIVGANTVAKAAPDGYTLLVYSAGFVVNPYVQRTLPYDTEKDFAPVTNLTSSGGLFLAVRTAMQKPAVLDRLTKLGVESAAGTPEEFRKFFLAELKAYGEMARLAGVKPE